MRETEPKWSSLFHMVAVIVFATPWHRPSNHTEFTTIFYKIRFNSLHITLAFIPLERFSRERSCLAPPARLLLDAFGLAEAQ